ncbi:hypothetical protein [Microcoleus sp. Pol17_C1]|uniref:hypothetical protein n=1 Tax=unclassified Microcoleus TaxID=2642155 RepID=UPI002FD3C947
MTNLDNDCKTTESESNELPDTTENGFITVSDFFAYQHESIETALKNSEFQYLIKFHLFDPDALWKQGAFRVYVAPEHLEAVSNLCRATEKSL